MAMTLYTLGEKLVKQSRTAYPQSCLSDIETFASYVSKKWHFASKTGQLFIIIDLTAVESINIRSQKTQQLSNLGYFRVDKIV